MLAKLKPSEDVEELEEPSKKLHLRQSDVGELLSKDLSDFVTPNTKKLFHRFPIETEFLNNDPSTWNDRIDYNNAKKNI